MNAGYCSKCRKFRYYDYKSELGEIICKDCAPTLKNQILVPLAPAPRKTPKTKPKKTEERTKKTKESIALKVLEAFRNSTIGMTVNDIREEFKISHRWALAMVNRLIEKGVIVHTSRARDKMYIHIDQAENLKKYDGIRLSCRKDAALIKSTIDGIEDLVSASDVFDILKGEKSRTCILNCLRFLVVQEKALSYINCETNTEYFVSAANEIAVKKFRKAVDNSLENRVLRFLKTGTRSRQAIAKHLGKNQRSIKAISKVIDKLENDGVVRTMKIGGIGIFCELAKKD